MRKGDWEEEDYIKELIGYLNLMATHKKNTPPLPDFTITTKNSSWYVEVTQLRAMDGKNEQVNQQFNRLKVDLINKIRIDIGRIDIAINFIQLPTSKTRDKTITEIASLINNSLLNDKTYLINPLDGVDYLMIKHYANTENEVVININSYYIDPIYLTERVNSAIKKKAAREYRKYIAENVDLWLLIRIEDGASKPEDLDEIELIKECVYFTKIYIQFQYDPSTKGYPLIEIR